MISIKPSIDALPTGLTTSKSQGYTFVTVDELLDYQLESHRIYYNGNYLKSSAVHSLAEDFLIHLKEFGIFKTSSRTEGIFLRI